MSRSEPLSPIPEILMECEEARTPEKRRNVSSPEDEGYGSGTQPALEQMLDGLAEMSRRLSLAPSDLASTDATLNLPLHATRDKFLGSKGDCPDVGEKLESFWKTVREEVLSLRASRDESRADSVLLMEELAAKTTELEEKDKQIERLKAELLSERKAGKQISEATEDLLEWVDSNRVTTASTIAANFRSRERERRREHHSSRELAAREISCRGYSSRDAGPSPTSGPCRKEPEQLVLEYVDQMPTYGVAFRITSSSSASTNKNVLVWKVQVVESYESNGNPIYFHGRHLPKTLKSYVKFLQFWCGDRLPECSKSAICVWCNERGIQTVWHKGGEAKRPCRECSLRGRHCFAVSHGVLRCLPIRDIKAFLKGEA